VIVIYVALILIICTKAELAVAYPEQSSVNLSNRRSVIRLGRDTEKPALPAAATVKDDKRTPVSF
jgi:hypothetical protein